MMFPVAHATYQDEHEFTNEYEQQEQAKMKLIAQSKPWLLPRQYYGDASELPVSVDTMLHLLGLDASGYQKQFAEFGLAPWGWTKHTVRYETVVKDEAGVAMVKAHYKPSQNRNDIPYFYFTPEAIQFVQDKLDKLPKWRKLLKMY